MPIKIRIKNKILIELKMTFYVSLLNNHNILKLLRILQIVNLLE